MSSVARVILPGSVDDGALCTLAYDFRSGAFSVPAGDPAITFTRSGATATRVNSAGLIESVAADTPRFDFDPVTLRCKGFLVEPTRTNVLLRSDAFGTSPWTIETDGSVSANQATSPDGTVSADHFIPVTTSGVDRQEFSATSGQTYAASIYISSASTLSQLTVYITWNGGAYGPDRSIAQVAIPAMTIAATFAGAGATPTVSISDAGNGWYRAVFIATANASGTSTFVIRNTTNADGVKFLRVWGAQVEVSGFATSYIPTTSASVTRNVDSPVRSSISDFHNAVEGTVFAEFIPQQIGDLGVFSLNNGGTSERIDHRTSGVTFVTDGGVGQATIGGGAHVVGATSRTAVAYAVNDFAVSNDGAAVVTDTSGTLPTVDRLQLALLDGGTGNPLQGHLRYVAYFPKRLQNASLVTLSTNGVQLNNASGATIREKVAAGFLTIPKELDPGLQAFLARIKELLEVRNAQIGSPLDANPTFRDLIESGLITVDPNTPLTANGREFTTDILSWLTSNIPTWVTDNTAPPVPTGFTLTPNSANVVLSWTDSGFVNYKQTLVYRANSNNLSSAVLIGSTTGTTYVDNLAPVGTTYYYWIRHESKSQILSDFNNVNGTSVTPAPDAPVLSYAFSGDQLVLSWTTPASNLAIQYYILSYGDTPGANAVGISQSNTFKVKADFTGTRTYWIQAVDIRFALGTAASKSVTVNPPVTTTVTLETAGPNLVVMHMCVDGSLPIEYFEVKYGGTTWDNATLLAAVSTVDRIELAVNWTGSRKFWVSAYDTAGNRSAEGTATFSPTAPSVGSLTPQVIDNNVLLRWTGTANTLPIAHYRIYKNTVFQSTVAGQFAVLFESSAASYTYGISAVDTAGNEGSQVTATVAVSAPPDFILFDSRNSTFSGTKTTVFADTADTGALYACVHPTETWEDHFTTRSWTTLQDQIDDGYPNYYVAKTSGSYVETVDYGATIASAKITMSPTTYYTNGTVTITPELKTSATGAFAGEETTFAGVYSAHSTSFRYVRYTLVYSAAAAGTGLGTDTTHLIGHKPLSFVLDLKLKTYQGMTSCNSGDSGGTSVDITGQFLDVQAITVTPHGTTPIMEVIDFTDTPSPTSFKILLFNDSGTRVSATASWTIRGV